MTKKIFIVVFPLFLILQKSTAQIIVTPLAANGKIYYNSQLWNLSLTNLYTVSKEISIQLSLADLQTNTTVLNGNSSAFIINNGSKFYSFRDIPGLNFQLGNSGLSASIQNNGLLPAGKFQLCYQVFEINNGKQILTNEYCDNIEIEPISPPILISPDNHIVSGDSLVLFQWSPPQPLLMFTALNYEIELAEINSNQNALTAISQNHIFYKSLKLVTNSLTYPSNAPKLKFGQPYAWRVTACNGVVPVIQSEVWEFKLDNTKSESGKHVNYTIFLSKDGNSAINLVFDVIKIGYENQADVICEFSFEDLSQQHAVEKVILDSCESKTGLTEFIFKVNDYRFLQPGHVYNITFINRKREQWSAKVKISKK